MNVYVGNRLPSTYQEVTYIQSSGTQYIKIGTQFKTSYKTVIDFQMTVTGGDYVPIGVRTADGGNKRYGIDVWNSYFKVIAGGGDWNNTIAEDTNRHTITLNKSTAIVDGTSYSVQYADWTFNEGIGVFYYHKIGETPYVDAISSNKLYKLDIYDENGTHIYDLVPCYRKSDNVIGLYDLVNNQFYTNSGTGTFSKGSDVLTNATLKNAYIGEVWTPGSNTLLYIPLDSTNTKNDIYGGNTTTQSGTVRYGTYGGVDCADFTTGGCIYSNMLNGVSTYTVLIWANNINGNSASDGYGGNVFAAGKPGASHYPGIYYGNSSSSNGYFTFYANNSSGDIYFNTNTKSHWFLFAICISSSTKKAYLFGDGSYKELDISSSTTNSQYAQIGGIIIPNDLTERTDRRFYGYLSNRIIENRAWTAQEISHYYDITKYKYGL